MNHFSQLRTALDGSKPEDHFTFESDENGEVPAAVLLETTGAALVAISETLADTQDTVAAIEVEEKVADAATASLESISTAEVIAESLVENGGKTEEEALAIVQPAIQDAEVHVDAEPGTLTDGTSLEDATSEPGGAKAWWGKLKETAAKLYAALIEALKRAKDYIVKVYEQYFDGATKVEKAAGVIAAAAASASGDREGKISITGRQTFKGKGGAAAIKAGVAQTTNFVTSAAGEISKLGQVDAKIKEISEGKEYKAADLKALVPGGMFSKNGALIGANFDASTGGFKPAEGAASEVEPASLSEIKEIANAVAAGAKATYKNSKDASKWANEIANKVTAAAAKLKDVKEGEKAEDAKKKITALTELRRFSSSAIKSVGATTTGAVLASYQNALTFARNSLPAGKPAAAAAK